MELKDVTNAPWLSLSIKSPAISDLTQQQQVIVFGQIIIKDDQEDQQQITVIKQEVKDKKSLKQRLTGLLKARTSPVVNFNQFGKHTSIWRAKTDMKMVRSQSRLSIEKKEPSKYDFLIFSEDSLFIAYWMMLMELIVVYNIFTSLFFLGFQNPQGELLAIDYATYAPFIANIIINFLLQRKGEKDQPIRNLKKISLIYAKTWLLFDLIPLIPLRAFGYQKQEYLLRLVRLVWIPKIFYQFDGTWLGLLIGFFQFNSSRQGRNTLSFTQRYAGQILQLTMALIFLVYFLGCIWFYFQDLVSSYQYSQEQTFAKYYQLQDATVKRQALASFYFILTTLTTVGYGDYFPRNTYQQAFIIFVLLIGVAYFAYIMGSVNNVIIDYDELSSGDTRMKDLNIWIQSLQILHGKLPEAIKKPVKNHFAYYFQNDRNRNIGKAYWRCPKAEDLVAIKDKNLKSLPEQTVKQVLKYLYSDIMYKFQYFFKDSQLVYDLVLHFQPRKILPEDFFVNQGYRVYQVYFVLEGHIICGTVLNRKIQAILRFKQGRTIVGDFSVLTNCPACASFQAVSVVHTFIIPKRPLIQILDRFYPEQKTRLIEMSAMRNNNIKNLVAQTKLKQGFDEDYIEENGEVLQRGSVGPKKTKKGSVPARGVVGSIKLAQVDYAKYLAKSVYEAQSAFIKTENSITKANKETKLQLKQRSKVLKRFKNRLDL